jgi:protocatechuate 3,4-dioxygenase beta subunit
VPHAAAVDFTYPRLYAIGGRVTDDQGKPVRDVLMQVTTNGFNGVYNSTLSASDGWYSLAVAAGTYTVTAYHQGFSLPPVQTVTVLPEHGDVHFVLTRVAPPDQVIQGKVLDETGQPAEYAVVTLAGEMAGKSAYFNGAFARVVYPGTYTVFAGGAGYAASDPQQVTVPPGRTDLVFTVRRADQFVYGEVTDQAGQPLCGASVEVTGAAGSSAALTNGSGRFAVRVPRGTYTIRASAIGFPAQAQTVTVPPTVTQLRFTLQAAPNTVEGTVRDEQGAPVAGASVTASSPKGEVSATTDANGRYTLHLPDGRWDISIRAAGIATPASRTITVPSQQTQVDFQVTRAQATRAMYLPAVVAAP